MEKLMLQIILCLLTLFNRALCNNQHLGILVSNRSINLFTEDTPTTEKPFRQSHEMRLVNMLLKKYNKTGKTARPIYNSAEKIQVFFGLRLIQLEVTEKEQAMKTSVWVRARWRDEILQWNPEEYGGLQRTTLPWDKVWLPDITLVNTAEAQTSERPADIMATFQGHLFWAPHKVFKSACLVDVKNFPYDEHTCHMWFQSMSRMGAFFDVNPYPYEPWDLSTYLSSFVKSQEWEIRDNQTQRFNGSRDAGTMIKFSRRPALRFSLTLRRRVGYTGYLLMLPSVFLVSMTLVVFCLPPERPDRHSLAMSLFGSLMVLLLILVGVAPPTAASIPKLGIYYACNMTQVMLCVFLSGTVVNCSKRGETGRPVPKVIKYIFIDVMSRPLLLHTRVSADFPPGEQTHTSELEALNTARQPGPPADMRQLRMQWRNVSIVMDRLFFVLYFIVIIVCMVVWLPWPIRS